MLTRLHTRLKQLKRWLPVALLPLLPLAAQAQFSYAPSNARNIPGGTYSDLGTTGTAIVTANTDDANSTAQALGFTFRYNGQDFTQFVLSTNGMLKLGASAPSATNLFICNTVGCLNVDPVESPDPANVNLIMPFNFDLEDGTGGPAEYRVATTGAAPNRVCTVQWKNVRDKSDASPSNSQYNNFSFQAKLYETTNTVEFVYGTATPSTAVAESRFPNVGLKGSSSAAGQDVLASKTTGAAAWSTTTFLTGSYPGSTHNFRNAALPTAGQTYRFTAGAACTDPTNPTISNVTNTSLQLNFTPGAGNVRYNVTYTPTGGATQTVTPAPTASPVVISGLTQGTTYNLSLQSVCADGSTGNLITGTVTTTAPAPANDDPAGAIVVPVATTCTPLATSNAGATTTAPTGYANPGCGVAVNPKDVWYKFTTAASGVGSTFVRIQVTGAPAGQIRAFSATSSAGPFTEVGCASGGNNNTVSGPLGLASLTPNTTYYLAISGYGSGDDVGSFTLCAVGLATPPAPTYATLPVTESFEGPWLDVLATRDAPSASWRNTPASGDNSWRRDDDGASANWSYTADDADPTLHIFDTHFSAGAHAARFHSYAATDGDQGKLDLYINLTGTGRKTLSFDYINPTGADKLDVLLSTDGGKNFGTTPLLSLVNSPKFAPQSLSIASTSATAVIRFQATSDFGDDDLGIDNVQMRIVTANHSAALAAAVSLYPNPAHHSFRLAVSAGSLHTASATLLNALGQVVLQRQLALPATGGTTDFDVSRLPAGVYSLQLKTGDTLLVKRVVVE